MSYRRDWALLPALEHHEGEFRAERRHLVWYTGRNFQVIAGMHGDGGAAIGDGAVARDHMDIVEPVITRRVIPECPRRRAG
jgi:hypothetical protein